MADMPSTGLPDPRDRAAAWWHNKPAYLAWFRSMTAADAKALGGYAINDLIRVYAHSVPTVEAIDRIATWGPLVELGAGAGYWARLLVDRGADMIAYDQKPPRVNSWVASDPPWSDVRIGDVSVLATHTDRTPFVSWPPRPTGFLSRVLDTYHPQRLVLIDGRNSLSESDPLYDRLESDWELVERFALPQWPYRLDSLIFWHARGGPPAPRT
jgi:hypothetical protein